MDRDQRRATGGIDRDVRSLQAQQVTYPPDTSAVSRSGAQVGVDGVLAARAEQVGVVARGDADEYAGPRAGDVPGTDSRVLERLPRGFEQQSVLRIHARQLARRNAEQLLVEPVNRPDKAAVARRHLAGR